MKTKNLLINVWSVILIKNGKITKVEKKIIFGDEQRIEQKLSQSISHTINTAYIERSNGILRQMDRHLRRKNLTFAKEKPLLKSD
jgi:IS1 family transposase